MFRVVTAAALLGSLVLTAGCNREPANYEVITKITGSDGAVVTDVAHDLPGGTPEAEKPTDLPFTRGWVIDAEDIGKGDVKVTATPTKGTLTCEIVIEKKVANKVEGKDGQPVTCSAKITKP